MRAYLTLAVIVSSVLPLPAANPPDRINYQGVLRDSAGAPSGGAFDMIFRLFDQQVGGSEMIQDLHLAANGTAVVVTDGLFSVEIGSAQVLDGSGPGVYVTLGEVFRDRQDLWLEIQIDAEVLAPRLHLAATGHALNSRYLGGMEAAEFLHTGPSAQEKSGVLTLTGTASPGAPLVSTGSIGARIESTSGALAELARYGDGLWAWSGPGPGSGGVFYSYGGTAVNALGAHTGGYFQDLDDPSWAYLANGDYGARISGKTLGAYVQKDGAPSYVELAGGDFGLRATSNASATIPWARSSCGLFEIRNAAGTEVLARASLAEAYKDQYSTWQFPYAASFENPPYGVTVSVAGADYSGVSASTLAGWGWGGIFHSGNDGFVLLGGGGVAGIGWDRGGTFEDTDSSSTADVAKDSYKITGSGSVAFAQNHPTEKDRVIVYNAPEGDEVATYTRGSARLASGRARVELGETFAWVTNPDLGLTAHLTPRAAAVALAVESLTTKELVVSAPAGAPPDLEFDYLVFGLRIGFEETSIVQEKREEMFIPSMASHRKLYADHPELRRYSALERVQGMRARMGLENAPDLSASAALREAIHEFDPAADKPMGVPDAGYPGAAPGATGQPGWLVVPPRTPGAGPVVPATVPAGTGLPPVPGAGADARDDQRGADFRESARDLYRDPPAATAAAVTLVLVSEPIRAGELVAIDPTDTARVRRTEGVGDPGFVGIAVADSADGAVAIGATGILRVLADASAGSIAPGDPLTASPTPGLAMRAGDPQPGTILGKALDGLEAGIGEIRVVWMPR